jgi:hypothetical protein
VAIGRPRGSRGKVLRAQGRNAVLLARSWAAQLLHGVRQHGISAETVACGKGSVAIGRPGGKRICVRREGMLCFLPVWEGFHDSGFRVESTLHL